MLNVMNKERILGLVEAAGLALVVIAAGMWVFPKGDIRFIACCIMSVATVVLACGRFMQTPFYEKYPMSDPRELTLRRLYHQRVFGIVGLIVACVFMWMPVGFYAGMYVGETAWLIPFVFFVVIEVYTVFRISAVEKG